MLSWYCVTFSEKQEGIIRLNAQTEKSDFPRLGIDIVVPHALELI